MSENGQAWQTWFEVAWAYREEVLYPDLFGDLGPGIFAIDPSVFVDTFKQDSFDPRWLHSGVFESAPNPKHRSWLYVSSGLSNPWDNEPPNAGEYSGVGCEFILETPAQGRWAIQRLQHLIAFQTLLSCGRYPGREQMGVNDRIPLRAPITPEPSVLTRLMLAYPEGYPRCLKLPSGAADLLHVVGITDAEADFARQHGGDALVEHLRRAGAFPVTDPKRPCTVVH
jgi:hypothetical protein